MFILTGKIWDAKAYRQAWHSPRVVFDALSRHQSTSGNEFHTLPR